MNLGILVTIYLSLLSAYKDIKTYVFLDNIFHQNIDLSLLYFLSDYNTSSDNITITKKECVYTNICKNMSITSCITTYSSFKLINQSNTICPWAHIKDAGPWAHIKDAHPWAHIKDAHPWAHIKDTCPWAHIKDAHPWAHIKDACPWTHIKDACPWTYINNPWLYMKDNYAYIKMSRWANIKNTRVYIELSPCAYTKMKYRLFNNKELGSSTHDYLIDLHASNKVRNISLYIQSYPVTVCKYIHIYLTNPSSNIYFSDSVRFPNYILMVTRLLVTKISLKNTLNIQLYFQLFIIKRLRYYIQLTQIRCSVNNQQKYIPMSIWLSHILYIIYAKLLNKLSNTRKNKQTHKYLNCFIDCTINAVETASLIPTIGGGPAKFEFEYRQLIESILLSNNTPKNEHTIYIYIACCSLSEANSMILKNVNLIICRFNISQIISYLNLSQAKQVAQCHNIQFKCRSSLLTVILLLQKHYCNESCYDNVFVLTPKNKTIEFKKESPYSTNTVDKPTVHDLKNLFPPLPPSNNDIEKIVQGFCAATNPSLLMEAGCAVCGLLCQLKNLILLTNIDVDLEPLVVSEITRQERTSNADKINEIPGPVLEPDCRHVCKECLVSLKKGKMPKMSLANGLWLGKVPKVLQDLKYAEKLLIARVRHNRCIVKVKASGRYKMRANAIVFENPIPKVYDLLPPPLEEFDQILAFMFTGPCKPTKDDLKRTPLLVRRNKVANALRWLILNHLDYEGVEISEENLNQYPVEDVPVVIDYRESIVNKEAEEFSLHDTEGDDGFDGDCSFVVHGLYGEEYTTMTTEALKAKALEHLTQNNKMLFVGHSKEPLTTFRNPSLFPSMMPWLFPYGFGGICNSKHNGKTSTREFKKHLLMYHDKRFQMDNSFALIAWNHEQIGDGATAGYLTANKAKFPEIVDRLTNLDTKILEELTIRLIKGGKTKPKNEKEETCYKLLNDLDHAGAKISGSVGSKKHLRNQIWSLISYIGAPSWFVTLSPADVKHPICLYYADTKEVFCPDIRNDKDAFNLIANNPVAAARFFHLMCETFIKEVLGVGSNHRGIYGNTNAYYGTVEQQGRLTLHLHMLIWIEHALSPQTIRDKVMDVSSDFQKKLVQYLESVCQGQCINGTMTEVKQRIDKQAQNDHNYKDPTKTLPVPPPSARCKNKNYDNCVCVDCILLKSWWKNFENTVDDLLIRSNRHTCTRLKERDEGKDKVHKACLNRKGECKARFPREVIPETMMDPLTGALKLRKGEAWMNTFNIVTTYLCRCNTDCTSLLSGTAIKAVVAYVCDYISKSGLSTYTAFDTIRQVLSKNSELIGGSNDRKTASRTLMIKMINALTAKMEMGSPMAAMYILGNPDHYTGHKFIDFYWKNYVHEAEIAWNTTLNDQNEAKVVLQRTKEKYIGISNAYDYIYRPSVYNNMDLFNWIRLSRKSKRTSKQQKEFNKTQEILKRINDFDMSLDIHNVESNDTSSTTVDSIDELDMFRFTSDYEDETPPSSPMQMPIDNECSDSDDEIMISKNMCNENLTDNIHMNISFLENHPQYQTHHVHCVKDTDKIIPNFMNGSLPRRDHGDQEYYCLTMLVLFKPWRSGNDLKKINQNWQQSFNEYTFSDRQMQLMDNFNIRYECNDARDDYSAQRHNDDNKNDETLWYDKMDTANLNMDDIFNDFEDDDRVIDDVIDIYLTPNGKHLSKLGQMAEIEQIVCDAGWLEKSPNGMIPIDKVGFQPDEYLSAAQWNGIVTKAKETVIQNRGKYIPTDQDGIPLASYSYNEVVVADASYINNKFHAESAEKQLNIDDTVVEFNLNTEQERAFRIIANHATLNESNQLKMYLGGMGGTGKSQVIKSLISFFEKNNEAHRIVILAPTGSAAALLNGSTYHSVLGIGSDSHRRPQNEQTTLAQVRTRLQGVDYIFIDEISMIACHEIYKISAQLSKARNCTNSPFGGVNMIFAGDFAQLKPVMGQALYNESVETILSKSQTQRGQESAIGKALWHQINTVIILKQNMRQNKQSPEDEKLRVALENMRYAACTPADIEYLKSRVAGKGLNCPKLADRQLRNISIITARNIQKDHINYLGSLRFAEDTGQTLSEFYSIDKWGEEADISLQNPKKKYKKKNPVLSPTIGPNIQEMLWNLHHSDTDHIPGKLYLCIGMPVMIRNNDATELCITKGQEGYVVGWQSSDGPYQTKILDTLFVKLDKPAKTIKLYGLPEDVVPLTRMSKTIKCVTPSGIQISLNRSQIQVLPNFAMTDYACQGKTRPLNVVDLNYCRDHQSYYTCLSRSSTSQGTIIIQGFNPHIITKGASGYLRQEFRELEILNEITKLKYEQQLPSEINGLTRNMLLRQFQNLKGTGFTPQDVPKVISWSDSNPMDKVTQVLNSDWQLIENVTNNNKPELKLNQFIPAQGTAILDKISTTPIHRLLKRKASSNMCEQAFPNKKCHTLPSQSILHGPLGLDWDDQNYSCAYDSLFTIVCNIYIENPAHWTKVYHKISVYLQTLAKGCVQVLQNQHNLNNVRDDVRSMLFVKNPNLFPSGPIGTDIADLAEAVFDCNNSLCISKLKCNNCNLIFVISPPPKIIMHITDKKSNSINKWFLNWQKQNVDSCHTCNSPQVLIRDVSQSHNFFVFGLSVGGITISKSIKIIKHDGKYSLLPVKGIIYSGNNHFVAQFVDSKRNVWFHDGMTTRATCILRGCLKDISEKQLMSCNAKEAVMVLYAKK